VNFESAASTDFATQALRDIMR